MAINIELIADKGLLRLCAIDNSTWCHVSYVGKETTELGADSYDIIKQKIRDVLLNRNDSQAVLNEYNNRKLFCVMLLFEKHAAIYGFWEDETLHLVCVENNKNILPDIILNKDAISSWLDKLE